MQWLRSLGWDKIVMPEVTGEMVPSPSARGALEGHKASPMHSATVPQLVSHSTCPAVAATVPPQRCIVHLCWHYIRKQATSSISLSFNGSAPVEKFKRRAKSKCTPHKTPVPPESPPSPPFSNGRCHYLPHEGSVAAWQHGSGPRNVYSALLAH